MIIYNGQSWLLYFEIANIRLGGQTCRRTFGFNFWDCVQSSFMEHEFLFFFPISFKLWAICVHVSLGL
jgi:hypothetical protein